MLKLPVATKADSIGNIVFRSTYTTGVITEDQGNGKYKVRIAGTDKEYPNIFTVESNPTYEVDDVVGILWEYGCREKPIITGILRTVVEELTTSGVNSLGI